MTFLILSALSAMVCFLRWYRSMYAVNGVFTTGGSACVIICVHAVTCVSLISSTESERLNYR